MMSDLKRKIELTRESFLAAIKIKLDLLEAF